MFLSGASTWKINMIGIVKEVPNSNLGYPSQFCRHHRFDEQQIKAEATH